MTIGGAVVLLAVMLTTSGVAVGAEMASRGGTGGLVGAEAARREFGDTLGSVEVGWELFRTKNCLQCHAVWGQGGDTGPDLGRTQTLGHVSAGQLAGTMWNHVPRMWQRMEEGGVEMTPISATEMGHLFAFLLFIHYADEPGDPGLGRRALERHQCDHCHVIDAEGGTIGPDLTAWGRYVNPVVWAQKMWRHAREMQDIMAVEGIRWPRFSGGELNDIVSFIRSRTAGERKEYMRPGSATKGRVLFEARGCASCHGPSGSATRVLDLNRADLPDTLSGIATRMWNHAPAMLEEAERRGRVEQMQALEAQEMVDIITYLLTRRYFFSPGDAEAGRRVFVAKRCVECHDLDGQGGTGGPRLSDIRGTASPIFMAHVMWQFGPKMLAEMTERGIPWPQFEDTEMSDLIAYLNASPEGGRGE
jgi:cytochrome c2